MDDLARTARAEDHAAVLLVADQVAFNGDSPILVVDLSEFFVTPGVS